MSTLDDLDVKGRTVLLRVDINCPIDRSTGEIADDTRIDKSLPTIAHLADAGSKLVVISHQGDTLDYHNLIPLREHAQKLSTKLARRVEFIDDVAGPAARAAIENLDEGHILLLDNLRFLTEEVSTFEATVKLSPSDMADTYLVRNLAPIVDIYVNDAFSAAHRNAPSMVAFQKFLPTAAGRLLVNEINALSEVAINPERPCVFILGGLKISDAFSIMTRVLDEGTADTILTAGVTANVFLMALGFDLGPPSMSFVTTRSLDAFVPRAMEILSRHGDHIEVPTDLAFEIDGVRHEISIDSLPSSHLIIDVGSQTVAAYKTAIANAGTIVVNGPAGVYESAAGEYGTRSLWEAVSEADGHSVIGGGDTVASARRFTDLANIGFVSTGGGSLIRYLSGQSLPLLEAMEKASRSNRRAARSSL